MLSNPKHVSTLPSYVDIINGIFPYWIFLNKQQNQKKRRLKTSLSWKAWLVHYHTRMNTIPLVHYKPVTVTHLVIILLDIQVMHIPYRNSIHVEQANLDMGFMQETKITDGVYTRASAGYRVVATDAPSRHRGGIAMFYREGAGFAVEEVRQYGPS